MQTSRVVDRFHEGGRAEGQLEVSRKYLLTLLENRFGSLPGELIQRIRDVKHVQQLNSAFQQALNLRSLGDLQLENEAADLAG